MLSIIAHTVGQKHIILITRFFESIINIKSKINRFINKLCSQTSKMLLQKQDLLVYFCDC